jgi:hypothetical protein
MAHDESAGDEVYASELRWRLSEVRQCVPERTSTMPESLDSEALLMLDIAETEFLRDEWRRIAESYRTLAEVAIEALAVTEDQNRKMRALIKNMGDELMLRKPQ